MENFLKNLLKSVQNTNKLHQKSLISTIRQMNKNIYILYTLVLL